MWASKLEDETWLHWGSSERESEKAGITPLPRRTNKGCLNLLEETGSKAVSEMDANSRDGRETYTGQVQNRKLPSGMHSGGERIQQISFPLKRWIIAVDGQMCMCRSKKELSNRDWKQWSDGSVFIFLKVFVLYPLKPSITTLLNYETDVRSMAVSETFWMTSWWWNNSSLHTLLNTY